MVLIEKATQVIPSDLPSKVYSSIEYSFTGGGELDLDHPIHAAYAHHFRVRGGGTRVLIVQQCAIRLGLSAHDICCLAAAVECLHNASLVQDDLQDKSEFRRGQSSVAAKFGGDVALGLTDQLITTAFVCLSAVNDPTKLPSLIWRINHAVAATVHGQTSELGGCADGVSLEGQLKAARRKSGPLFGLSLELPLILSGHQASVETAHEAACGFGLGYQILDDLKDQVSDAASGSRGNLVFALAADVGVEKAPGIASDLARHLLQEAAELAMKLPFGSGMPLVELGKRLLAQIDAFKP